MVTRLLTNSIKQSQAASRIVGLISGVGYHVHDFEIETETQEPTFTLTIELSVTEDAP